MDYVKLSKTLTGKLSKFRLKKYRDEQGVFMAEGSKCVEDTIENFELVCLVATVDWLNKYEIRPRDGIYAASRAELDKISTLATPADVIAFYKKPEQNIDEDKLKSGLTLLLDDVQDPGNIGTIIRLADWFGVYQIIASPSSADVYNTKAIMATMGSISRVKVFYKDLQEFISQYAMIPTVGLLLDGEDIYHSELPENAFIIMGNEGRGISEKIRQCLSHKLLIPPYPKNEPTGESLNVAMATAITLSEFRRRMN